MYFLDIPRKDFFLGLGVMYLLLLILVVFFQGLDGQVKKKGSLSCTSPPGYCYANNDNNCDLKLCTPHTYSPGNLICAGDNRCLQCNKNDKASETGAFLCTSYSTMFCPAGSGTIKGYYGCYQCPPYTYNNGSFSTCGYEGDNSTYLFHVGKQKKSVSIAQGLAITFVIVSTLFFLGVCCCISLTVYWISKFWYDHYRHHNGQSQNLITFQEFSLVNSNFTESESDLSDAESVEMVDLCERASLTK